MFKLKYEMPEESALFDQLSNGERQLYARDAEGDYRLQFEAAGQLTNEERATVRLARIGASAEVESLLAIIGRLALEPPAEAAAAPVLKEEKVKKSGAQARMSLGGTHTEEVVNEIFHERARQIFGEGSAPEHDDAHGDGQMAAAAASYCLAELQPPFGAVLAAEVWPWSGESYKPGPRRKDLVRAAAMIVAEIERLDRAAKSGGQP